MYLKKKNIGEGVEIIGLDLRNNFLRVVIGNEQRGKIIISDFAGKQISLEDKDPSAIAAKLKELLEGCGLSEARLRKTRVQYILSGNEVCIRVIKVPFVPDDEIPPIIKAKIKEVVSYPVEEMVFDFSILGETEERGIRKINVAFMAMQKDNFSRHLEILKGAGIQPKLVTSPCFCGWNLIKTTASQEAVISLILVSIDEADTDISVFQQGKLLFTRNIPFGNKDLVEVLKNELGLSIGEAEEVRQEYGLSAETIPPKYKFSPQKVKEALKTQVDILCKELELTASHFHQLTHGETINKYLLMGSGAGLKGLKEFLAQRLDVAVMDVNIPPARVDVVTHKKEGFQKNSLSLFINLGAMLANPEDVNLMSSGKTKKYKLGFLKFFLVPNIVTFIFLGIVSLAVIVSIFLVGQRMYYRYQIKLNTAQWEHLQSRVYKVVQLKRNIGLLGLKKKIYARIKEKSIFYPEVIAQISKSIPKDKVALENLDFSRGPSGRINVVIKGLIQDPAYTATKFMLTLENTGYFENLSLSTSQNSEETRIREEQNTVFTIKGELKNKK